MHGHLWPRKVATGYSLNPLARVDETRHHPRASHQVTLSDQPASRGNWVITLPGAPVIARGPYRLLRHPNYAVSLAETLFLPLAFGQLALGVIFAVIWAAVLQHKCALEERALAERRGNAAMVL